MVNDEDRRTTRETQNWIQRTNASRIIPDGVIFSIEDRGGGGGGGVKSISKDPSSEAKKKQ
jgi:hypothetical protein